MTAQHESKTDDSKRHKPQPVERVCLSVEEAGRALGIGRNSAYEAVRSGQIPSLKIGGRYVIPRKALDRLLDGVGSGA